jgi:acetoin utilization deacetylase AcuC-like enzyme
MPQSTTILHIGEAYLNHVPPEGHPEGPDRIRRLIGCQALFQYPGVVRVDAGRRATRDELLLVHTEAHISRIAATAGKPHVMIDADTYTSALSFETASLAVGGVLDLVDAVMRRDAGRGFALVRPPGHHAETGRAMGFCLFNNVAVAARCLIERHRLERVLIVDWDVHHGNGTQQIFYGDDRVLYASLHQYPLYPGTGSTSETGNGRGEGYTVNVPVPPGAGDDEFLWALGRVIAPIAEEFQPQFVLLSAGFDAHRDDPLASLRVTESGFASMTSLLLDVAGRCCDGRIAAVLEGGYDLDALARSVEAVVRVMSGVGAGARADSLRGAMPESPPDFVSPVIEIQSKYWNL